MAQLVELEKRVTELRRHAQVYIVNVDTPQYSRFLKINTGTTIPVLLDNDLSVSRRYDMHARPGVPMGGMRGVPAMGFVIIDGQGVVHMQRSHLYFGRDVDMMLKKLKSI